MQSYTKFEKLIKEAVAEKTAELYPSEDMFNRIQTQLIEERERGIIMNTGNRKRTRGILVACIILILTTVTCFAAVKIVSYTSHSSNNDFKSYPTEKEMQDKAGFLPEYIESFSNGFAFKNGGIGESTSNDNEGNVVDKVKMVTIVYEKNDKSIYLNVENGSLDGDTINSGKGIVNITKEQQGRYNDYMNKLVPPGYEMTEQDKAEEAAGTFVFSYGSEEVEINHIQEVAWNKDGMEYSLMSMDDGVIKEELIEMAGELSSK